MLIKGEEYSPSLRISELTEDITINYPSVIAQIKILKPDATKIVIPKVRFEEILLPNCILLQGRERPLEKDKAREELETRELLIAGGYEGPGGEVETEEKSDFLDLLFSAGSSGKLESGEPIVICLEEPEGNSFIGALRTICKRIYREKKGGKPKPIIFSDAEELKKEIRWMEAEDKIFSAQLSEEEWKGLEKQDVERIFNRIEQLFSQHFGFIRHFKELRDIKHNYKDWQKKHRKEIAFYTLDIENWDLLDIDKVAIEEFTEGIIFGFLSGRQNRGSGIV